jgi:hypothetical protein
LTKSNLCSIIITERGKQNPKRKEVKTMKNAERIEAIERQLFYLAMKDHWNNADWARNAELNRELAELKKEN